MTRGGIDGELQPKLEAFSEHPGYISPYIPTQVIIQTLSIFSERTGYISLYILTQVMIQTFAISKNIHPVLSSLGNI